MYKDTKLEPDYPRDITQFSHGMPSQSIETAVWWEDVAKTYFFKGDRWGTLEKAEKKKRSRIDVFVKTENIQNCL